ETVYAATVAIANVAPTATLGNDGPVPEGSPATIAFVDPSDPSSADLAAGLHYAFACDGNSLAAATYATGGADASTDCTFDDGPSNRTVRARVFDKDGGFAEYQATVAVTNVAPNVTAPADQAADEGSTTSFALGSFGDPGADSPWAV